MIDFDTVWNYVIEHRELKSEYSLHGPDHWRRVERHACILASRTGANLNVVRLFAVFHDSCRIDDGWDRGHGQRGADYAAKLRGTMFDLADAEFDQLYYACVWHTDAKHHADTTIGTCWDADRLDLGRVGIHPDARYMSTAFGVEIASHGSIRPWFSLADSILGPARPLSAG